MGKDKESIIDNASENFKAVASSKLTKFAKLPDWLGYISYYFKKECEKDLPKSYYHYKRGSVINVDFGVNLGSEFSFTHLAVVLNKQDNRYKTTLTVLPLTSKDGKDRLSLGKDIFNQTTVIIQNKQDEIEKELNSIKKDMTSIENKFEDVPDKQELLNELQPLGDKLETLGLKLKMFQKVKNVYMRFNKESYVRLSDITTISKLRINRINKYDPSGQIRLTQEQMKKIDIELSKLFLDKL